MGVAGAAYLLFVARRASALPGVSSQVTLVRPLNQQFPPVGRVDQDYTWTVSPQTFSSLSGSLTYTATGLPQWLSFSNSTMSFTGHPSSTDVGSCPIYLTATMDNGEQFGSDSINMTVTSRSGPVTIHDPISKQFVSNNSTITSCYPYPATSSNYPGARVPPGWSFSMGFEPSTFTAPTRVFYYAALGDGSPLPPWLTFNNQTVTFDGVAPYSMNDTEKFNIVVAGSDTFGYADVTESFNLTIALHELSLNSTGAASVNITTGSWSSTPLDSLLASSVTLDGQPVTDKDIVDLQVTCPVDWLSYCSTNQSLNGVPPTSQSPISLPISIADIYGDLLDVNLTFSFVPSAFLSQSLGPILINSTKAFTIDLDQVALDKSSDPISLNATFQPESASGWIKLKDHTLTGTIPPNLTYSDVVVDLIAKDHITNAFSSATLALSLAPEAIQSASIHAATNHGMSKSVKIVLGTIIGAIAILMCLMLALVMRKRRKEKQAEKALRTMNDEGRYGPEGDHEAAIGGATEASNGDGDDDWKWQEHSMDTPSMEYTEKMPEPLSAQMLVPKSQRSPIMSESEMANLPYISSGQMSDGNDTWAARTVRYLKNPFSRKPADRILPNISHPVIMPSFSNAAFQAQLAAAVDSAGIVKRGGVYTYPETPAVSGLSSGLRSSAGGETGDMTNLASSAASQTEGETTDSHFHGHSSRASWESEPPFVWATTDTPGRKEASESEPRSSTVPTLASCPVIEPVVSQRTSMASDTSVQRSDFRPRPIVPAALPSGMSVDANAQDISIDNIHFPTDSDIAQTESSACEQDAVITTASRIDARRTLESPLGSSPASHHSDGMPIRGPSPANAIVTTQSRLVSLGKEKMVTVRDPTPRDASQTAVVMTSRSVTPNHSASSSVNQHSRDQGNSTPPPLPAFPSLPAIPYPADTAPLHRILLGANEAFHFYPPLNIAASPSSFISTTTASTSTEEKPVGKPGATYEALVEVKEGLKRLPSWINFEDMELWGLPKDEHRGVCNVRVMETHAQTGAKRTVGRFSIEVSGICCSFLAETS